MFLINLLYICSFSLISLSLFPYFNGQSIEDFNSFPMNVPFYFRDRPVFLERPIILTPKYVLPNSNNAFQPNDFLNTGEIYTSSYQPNQMPHDADLDYSTERKRRRRKRQRKRRKRRRFG